MNDIDNQRINERASPGQASGERGDRGQDAAERQGGAPRPDAGSQGASQSPAADQRDPVTATGSDLAARLAAAEAEIAQLKDDWLRAKAETENVRRQAAADREKTRKFAVESFAESLLPVRDALEATLANENAALDTLRSGVELTLRQLSAAFDKAQITDIDPLGQRFDPHRHQAMTMVDSDRPPHTVVHVMQKGYALNDRVLRPALVTVARSPEASGERDGDA